MISMISGMKYQKKKNIKKYKKKQKFALDLVFETHRTIFFDIQKCVFV